MTILFSPLPVATVASSGRNAPVTAALNSGGCAELFVLDSRVRGNDDLGMVAGEGVGRVTDDRRISDDGTDMSVPYDIARSSVTVTTALDFA